jgi:Tfp pilus assembly protein PilP
MRSLLAFLLGVYIGQEYGKMIPNLKNESIKLYENIQKNILEYELHNKNKKQ